MYFNVPIMNTTTARYHKKFNIQSPIAKTLTGDANWKQDIDDPPTSLKLSVNNKELKCWVLTVY